MPGACFTAVSGRNGYRREVGCAPELSSAYEALISERDRQLPSHTLAQVLVTAKTEGQEWGKAHRSSNSIHM